MSKPRRSPPKPKFRLSGLKITDYKAIDHLELSLPAPTLPDTPDVFVLGSKNGVGKTSVLECAALGVLSAVYPIFIVDRPASRTSLFEQLIRAGKDSASISVVLSANHKTYVSTTQLDSPDVTPAKVIEWNNDLAFLQQPIFDDEQSVIDSLLGRTSEPLLLPPLLAFHSYRKVTEGRVELGTLIDPQRSRRRFGGPFSATSTLSAFKITLIRALMQKSGLFESRSSPSVSDDSIVAELNTLLTRYAGGKVDKLGASADNGLDLRITPKGRGKSYSFDGLSSGQKEIIATMFLIWFTTRAQPSLVLIDEPELHLNPEWQRTFVHDLTTLAPENQYLFATHAEEIFGSVPTERRLMLSRED
jgi:energy-coupling factor transporter ATP-binding protein EcfA2